jgi:rhamnosyltransferase
MNDWKPRVAIIMRSCNDSDVIRGTLDMVRAQSYTNYELWNFDSTSTDGTLGIIREYNAPERILLNDPASYNPGRVLNSAVAATSGEILVFLNSDATPQSTDWLARLIAPLQDPGTGACFGRQSPRPDCRSLFVKDTERAFGNGRTAAGWLHFFSMANSAVRRELLEQHPFETDIQYSEDIEWSWRMRNLGHRIVYVSDADAMHSHNYTLRQSYRRHFGGLDLPPRRTAYHVPALLFPAAGPRDPARRRLGGASHLPGCPAALRAAARGAKMGALAGPEGGEGRLWHLLRQNCRPAVTRRMAMPRSSRALVMTSN